VAGFGLVGLKRTVPSLVSTAVWFGVLAALAVPVADTAGLAGLWTALACANLLQAVTKFVSFRRHSARIVGAVVPAVVPGTNTGAGAAQEPGRGR
jgi:MATE family multidrug resistance protein